MYSLFEYSDKLNNPCECFTCSDRLHSVPVKPHFHYFVEIIYQKEGSVLVYSEEESYVLSAGDMVLFLPSTIHSIYALSDAPFCYEVLKFDPAPFGTRKQSSFGNSVNLSALFAAACANRRQKNVSAEIYFPSETLQPFQIDDLFHTCIVEMEQKQYGYQTLIHSKIEELLTYILRHWRAHGFDTDILYAPAKEEESIYSITEYIDQHLGEELSVEALANQCHMSYSYFAKNFREVYGQSCKKYILSMRLSKAEELLLFTNFDLNHISQETGFSDCSHLIHAFKEKYGITPHQYRLSHHV